MRRNPRIELERQLVAPEIELISKNPNTLANAHYLAKLSVCKVF